MEEKLGPLQALGKFWGTLNPTQRFISAAFLSLSVVLLVIVSIVATRPHMGVLFSGLEPDDAGTIIAKLQENDIPYEVDGSAIKVPEKRVHEMRMQLASQGLPQGSSVGFEIFDKSNLGMTEFSQRMSYQRALSGELSRTINQLEGVIASRVHIAVPEPSVFTDKDKAATASVVVKLRPGGKLGSDQVGGIVHLVSSAVEGLKPNHVTVVDTNGNLLSEASDESTGLDPRLSASQLRLKRDHEQQMEKNIQSMLERVLGSNKAIVRVNAKINFDRRETSSTVYQPLGGTGNGVLLSEQKLDEAYGSGSGTTGGVVGARARLRPGGGPTTTAAGEEGGYRRSETNSKYEVSKITEHVIKAPGEVERVSVAVMVDGKVDASKIPAIRNAVATAAGIDLAGKDKITVESVDFDDSAVKQEEKELKAIASRSTYLSAAKTAGAVILLVVFLFFLRGLLSRINVSIPESVTVQEIPAGQAAAMSQAYRHMAGGGNGGAQPGPQAPPEEVAQVVRKWMTEKPES